MNAIRSVTPNAPPLDAQGFIAAYAPCIKCRYDLRGLKPDAVRPECGERVVQSFTGLLLRCVPVLSLDRLRIGLLVMLGGYLCLGACIALLASAAPAAQGTNHALGLCAGFLYVAMQSAGIVVATFPFLERFAP